MEQLEAKVNENAALDNKSAEKAKNPQIEEISFEDLQIFVGIKQKQEIVVEKQIDKTPIKQKEKLQLG